MNYIALLRGINVGGNNTVQMTKLKLLFEALGLKNVSTYLNSGNVYFESDHQSKDLRKDIEYELKKIFGFTIATLIKTQMELVNIVENIPEEWKTDLNFKCDVAFLFPEIDSKKTLDEFLINKKYVDIRYTNGAVFWYLDRKNSVRSRLNKIICHKYYKLMTIRNINTTRFLAKMNT